MVKSFPANKVGGEVYQIDPVTWQLTVDVDATIHENL